MNGTVKTINFEKGFGFIKGEDNVEYFFHRTSLKNIKIDELEKGRAVTFDAGEGGKGPRAEDVFA